MDSQESAVASNVTQDPAVPSQVLDYYKQYSQDHKLPQYFCASKPYKNWMEKLDSKSVKEAEEIIENTIEPCCSTERPPLIGQDEEVKVKQADDMTARIPSPASSVTSNRKLEWDNGADIGYENVTMHKIMHKSVSLPVLSALEKMKLQKGTLRYSPEGDNIDIPRNLKPSSSDSSDERLYLKGDKIAAFTIKPVCSSTSTSTYKTYVKIGDNYSSESSNLADNVNVLSDSDSRDSDTQNTKNFETSKDILRQLKQKIGMPNAESTPLNNKKSTGDSLLPNNSFITPVTKKPEKSSDSASPKSNLSNLSDAKSTKLSKHLSNSLENVSVNSKPNKSLKRWHSQFNLVTNEYLKYSKYKNMKILKLSVSKPVVIECAGVSKPDSEDKFIQTSLKRNVSQEVQTDVFYEPEVIFNRTMKQPRAKLNQQSVLFIEHSDTDKQLSSTNTNSDVALSNCNSFEYLYGEVYNQKLNRPQEELINQDIVLPLHENKVVPEILTKLVPSLVTSDSDQILSTSKSTSRCSKDGSLGKSILKKHSEHLIPDLEKTVALLQRLLQSNRYDPSKKRYYMKKIVQKLLDSKYLDDTSESSSKVKGPLLISESSEVSSSSHNDIDKLDIKAFSNFTKEQYLQDNVPWVPVQAKVQRNLNDFKKSSQKRLQTQTFSNELLPNFEQQESTQKHTSTLEYSAPTSAHQNVRNIKLRNPRFTLTSMGNANSTTSSHSSVNELYKLPQKNSMQAHSSSTSTLTNNSLPPREPHFSRNWREEKTLSEHILEQKCNVNDSKKDEDLVVQFAKKEREHQLNWINNEIGHLSKLKGLLEKERYKNSETAKHKVMTSMLQRPHVGDMKGVKKSTAVYVITTEKSENSSMKESDEYRWRRLPSESTKAPNSVAGVSCRPYTVRNTIGGETIEHFNIDVVAKVVSPAEYSSSIGSSCKPCGSQKCSPRKPSLVGPPAKGSSNFKQQNLCDLNQKQPQTNTDTLQFEIHNNTSSTLGRHEFMVQRNNTKIDTGQYTTSSQKTNNTNLPAQFCGMGAVDLQKASLVSNEICTTSKDGSEKITVRRYTFEVPLECPSQQRRLSEKVQDVIKNSLHTMDTVKSHQSSTSGIHSTKVYENGYDKGTKIEQLMCKCLPFERGTNDIKEGDKLYLSGQKINRETGSHDTLVNSYTQTERDKSKTNDKDNEYKRDHQDRESKSNSKINQELHNSEENDCRCASRNTNTSLNKDKLKDEKVPQKKDEMPTKKANGNETNNSITESELERLSTRDHKDNSVQSCPTLSTKNKKIQCLCESSSSSNSSVSDSSSSDDFEITLCHCCKREKIYCTPQVSETNPNEFSEANKLCRPCYAQSQKINWTQSQPYYTYPGHVCNCYSYAQNQTIHEMRNAIQELVNLEENYCRCSPRNIKGNSNYCPQCKCQLQKKGTKPVAYMLTFDGSDADLPRKHRARNSNASSLEEIRIKIPNVHHKKKDKDDANRKQSSKDGTVTAKHHSHKETRKKHRKTTLQEYLCINKPNFIESAEQRRKCMIDLAYMREQRCQKYKQLLALTNGVPLQQNNSDADNKPKRVFSSKEMRQMTAKNYKKLPEVQQKLIDNREKQVKKANRLLADIFNKKLRERVLKGKRSLSASVSVINLG